MFKKDSNTDEPRKEAKSSGTGGKGAWFKENQRSIIAVGLIMIMAFVMRFIFSVGVSADSAFALSGGSAASEHLHTINEILTNGAFFGTDGSLNYPFGSVNTIPIFIDSILAGIAMIGVALGMATVKAASLTLATFSLMCGTLAVIPMFLLGKEIMGTKKAGYAAALFLAFCPIVITQTAFSNGTETGWILFLFLILVLLMFRGLKEVNAFTRIDDSFKNVILTNRSALRISAIAGLVLALIVLSTNAFRPIVVLLIVAMAVMAVIGRFQYRDVRMVVVFFSVTITIGILVAAAYYIPAKLFEPVLSGILVASFLSVAICLSFALLQNKPWVVTIPAYLIGIIVFFALLSAFAPEFYSDLVKGNSVYADAIVALTGSSLSISQLSADFGVVTMWLSILVIGVLIWKLPKNLSSTIYQFQLVFMIASVIMCAKSSVMATVFSPVYAICFAYIVMWIFDHVDFKTYFLTIKNAGLKNSWRKALKPIPFVTLLAVAGLICVPIAMYAVDASIPSNSTDDYDGMDLGATGYYIKTDSDWVVGPVLSGYKDVAKTGALVTWIDYADDSATFGNFDVILDQQGNGSEAAANILLSNAVDGSASASMLVYLLTYTGMTDNVKAALIGAGLSEDDYNKIVDVMNDPAKYRSEIVGDVEKYGILRTDISDVNVKYVYIKTLLAEKYKSYQISAMYSAVSIVAGKSISYFMVDGNMFPMYYGYNSLFSTMGYVNGYTITDSYGTVAEFLTTTYYTQYYGIYSYTDAMYNTLLWRTYIGMSPTEAGMEDDGYTTAYTYFNELSLSNGTYKAQPGYGLSNFQVDYQHWYVMYNPSEDATVNGDGWVKMLYDDAITKQENEGGLINYLSGLPVFMKYVPNSGESLSGYVKSNGTGISGIRVSVVDAEGTVRSTAYTGEDGSYTVMVSGENPKIRFYAGSQNLTDGTLIKTVDYTSSEIDVNIDPTTVAGVFVNSDGDEVDMTGSTMTLTGTVSGKVYSSAGATPTITLDGDGFAVADCVPDIYTVTLKSDDGKTSYVTKKTITVSPGDNKGIKVAMDIYTVTLTFVDDVGTALPKDVIVWMNNVSNGYSYRVITGENGITDAEMTAGTYWCDFEGGYVSSSAPISVSGDSSFTIKSHMSQNVDFGAGFPENKMVSIYTTGYQTTATTNGSGVLNGVKLPAGTGGAIAYTAYTVKDGTAYISKPGNAEAVTGSAAVSGTLKNSSGNASSGTILFVSSEGYQIPAQANSEGAYSVILKTDTYTVYANSGSDVSITSLVVSETMTYDIEMKAGTKISGYTYWGPETSSVNIMAFVPVAVSQITGCDGCSFTVLSDNAGAYSFYVPKDSTCKLVATCKDPFYYGTESTYTSEKTEVSSTADFVANTGSISVTNGSGKTIKIGNVSIPTGESKPVPVKSTTWTIEVDDTEYYSSKTVPSKPGMGGLTVTAATFDGIEYYMCTITVAESDSVDIKAIDEEAGDKIAKKSTGTERKYWLQDGKSFLVTVKNSDSTKIMYDTVLIAGSAGTVDATTLSDIVTVEGYVGMNSTGKIKATYSLTEDYEFDVSSGRYSILLPADRDVNLEVTIENQKSDITYVYKDSRDVTSATLAAAGGKYICNFAVSDAAPGAGSDKITAAMTVDTMTAGAIAEVEFTVTFTNTEAPVEETTYTLAGGSAWANVVFYSDAARTQEISVVTFNNTATVYGKGTVIKKNVAFGADDLSVILTDINEKTACTAKFTGGENNWTKTEASAETTKVDTTTNTVGDSEYKYTLKLINDDNFTKTYTLGATGIDTEKWFVRYVYDNTINTTGVIDVKGYTTAVVYVKITCKGDATDVPVPETVTITVNVTGSNGITTDTESTVAISGNTATATSASSSATITVEGNGASGRNVLDARSDIPVYVWVLMAIMLALVFLIIWMASKRGVFTRRK